MDMKPVLTDYRPILRGWVRCPECCEWYHPDEYHVHTNIYSEDESGNRVIMHDPPKRRIDGSEG
jgi:hypothetical protein